MLVKELSKGSIVWHQNSVLGIRGATLPEMFDKCKCRKVGSNDFDYELMPQEFTSDQETFIAQAVKEWTDEEPEDTDYEDDYTVDRVVDTMNDIAAYGFYDGLPF